MSTFWDSRAGGGGWAVAPPGARSLYSRLAARARATFLRAVLSEIPRGPVLEVGCGKGPWLRVLAARGFAVTGVDLSWAMLRASRGPGARAQMDAASLGCRERSFDTVLAVTMLQHLADPPTAIAELTRVARRRVVIHELTTSPVPGWLAPHVFARPAAWYIAAFQKHGWSLRLACDVAPPPAWTILYGPRALAQLAARHTWLVFAPGSVDGMFSEH